MNPKNKTPDFRLMISSWEAMKLRCRQMFEIDGKIHSDEVKYFMAPFLFKDLSLIYDDGIFEFKPPYIYKSLWFSSRDQIITLMNILIDFQKNKLKNLGGINSVQFDHVLILQNIIDHVIQIKLGGDLRNNLGAMADRKKIMAGDFKNKTHFTR